MSPDAPDGIWLDITGCAGLFGTEKALLKDLHRRVAASGLSVQIAVADTAGCAHAVARHVPAGRPVTIEPGAQRAAIAILPIIPDSAAKLLDQMGIAADGRDFAAIEDQAWYDALRTSGYKVAQPVPLFPRLELEEAEA